MPNDLDCPAENQLSAFAVGRTTDAEARAIETHLAVCPQCVAVLERAPGDPLVVAVRQSKSAIEVAEREGGAAIVRLPFPIQDQSQTTDASLSEPTETCVPLQPAAPRDDTEEVYAFLSRTTESGEVGRLGSYKVLGPLGRGGMGVVFRAEDVQLQRPVALKVLRPQAAAAPEAVRRFLEEARAAARFKHDHVVTIYQVGEDEGVPYLAMELLEGETLEEALARDSRMSMDDVCRVGIETAMALGAAHAQGMVHRDIKPANLWLEKPGGRVKVLDFGLARAISSDLHLTSQGAIVGTPAYMAPEQARGETVDGRTDLFALGVVLYRALVGKAPFRGNNTVGTLLAVTTHTPPSPRSLRPEIPQQLSDLVMRLLEKEPGKRPHSAADVAEKLETIRAETRTTKPPRQISRVAIAAGFFAVCAVVAAVTVIIRDKDGNKIAEVTAQNGVGVEVRTTPEPGESPASPTSVSDSPDSPPSLDEWLKGRPILTVSHDARGQFKTIQSALDALKPGQAIQILDQGPYREQLKRTDLPRDTGLFSTCRTIIECPGWQEVYKEPTDPVGQEIQVYSGHILSSPKGFRLHGLEWRFASRGGRSIQPLTLLETTGLILEQCVFRATDGDDVQFVNVSNLGLPNPPAASIVVRDCLFESQLWLNSRGENSRFLVERNLFAGPSKLGCLVVADSRTSQLIVRQNVFLGQTGVPMLTIARPLACEDLQIVNNTFDSTSAMQFVGPCPSGGAVSIRNNIHTGNSWFVIVTEEVKESVAAYLGPDRLGQNAYTGPLTGPSELPAKIVTTGDYRRRIPWLSSSPDNPDYLRIAREVMASTLPGAGGELANYRGALPPGSAPQDGDWFTRLMGRWKATSPSPAPGSDVVDRLANSLPLEEWLKGRTVLTVSQDGKGQYRTIQAALDALQPGQVVKVLDKGPYKESLKLENPPEDIGLVSVAQTTLEVKEWSEFRNDNSKYDTLVGQLCLSPNGFRLSGFELVGTVSAGTRPLALLNIEGGARLTIEDCRFRLRDTDGSTNPAVSAIRLNGLGQDEHTPLVIRDCVLNGSVWVNGWPGMVAPPVLVLRNYMETRSPGYGLLFNGQLRRTHVRSNVVTTSGKSMPFIYDLDSSAVPPELVEVVHNTFVGPGKSRFLTSAPRAGVVIRNNILPVVQLGRGAERQQDVIKNWEISGNLYPIQPESIPEDSKFANVYRRPDDPPITPKFLSEDPQDRDFARLAAMDGIGSAGALAVGANPERDDWFTRLRERWGGMNQNESGTPSDSVNAKVLAHANEPPLLEDWLKGRTVLTVSQDGNGQFQSIQAALEALKPGQVVQVLDRGPYRETLLAEPPADTALFSTVQTVIELPNWTAASWKEPTGKRDQLADIYLGHRLRVSNGFRLHGFDLRFPDQVGRYDDGKWHRRMSFRMVRGVVLENCLIRGPGNQADDIDGAPIEISGWDLEDSPEMSAVVRDCVIDGSVVYTSSSKLAFGTGQRGADFLLARNWFPSRGLDHHVLVSAESLERLTVRDCLFTGQAAHDLIVARGAEVTSVEVAHCYLDSFAPMAFTEAIPRGEVVLRNNLRSGTGMACFMGNAEMFADEALRIWRVEHNAHQFSPDRVNKPRLLKRVDSDVAFRPNWLSLDLSKRDTFRLSADDPLGKAGTDGTYIGPFPAGPAPADGDWFTRLREWWVDTEQNLDGK